MTGKTIKLLRRFEYPGRVIIVGGCRGGRKAVVLYAVTGRSASSQARRIDFEKDVLWVRPTDKEVLKKGNIELLVYPALFLLPQGVAVSNGQQTVDIMACVGQSPNASEVLAFALKRWDFEPDGPTFTPRISGCVLSGGSSALSVVKRAPDGSTMRQIYEFALREGGGRMIATYSGPNRDPLPSFSGEPVEVEIAGDSARALAESVYESLGPVRGARDLRVAAAGVVFEIEKPERFEFFVVNRAERITANGKDR